MLRRLYIRHYLSALIAAVITMTAVTACSDDDADFPGLDDQSKAGYITLNVKNSRAVSKATVADDDNNENVIRSLVLCLFPADNPSGKPKFVKKYDFNKQTQVVIQEKFSRELADVLFPSGATTCGALVVANLPDADADAITVETSLDDIRRIAVSSEVFKTVGIPDDFVMDGDATVTRTGANTAQDRATGNVDLRRAAARISLAASVEESVTDADGQKWKPLTNQIKLILNNGVYRSAVNPANHTNAADDYFNTPWANSLDIDTESANKYPYRTKVPFYTYPNSWVPDAADSHMTYITLLVPWQKEGAASTQFQNFYYMVPVVKTNELVRNVAYQVNINVGVLGSSTPDEPFIISPASYTAVNWSDLNMDITIGDNRYLVVDQNTYTMDNVADFSIPVYTSHPTVISDIKVKYFLYNRSSNGIVQEVVIDSVTAKKSVDTEKGQIYSWKYDYKEYESTAQAAQDTLRFHHELLEWTALGASGNELKLEGKDKNYNGLDNISSIASYRLKKVNGNTVSAYSRYEVEITVQHVGHPEFNQIIKITQYPQIYIVSNGGERWTGSNVSAANGNTYVNASQSSSGGWYRTAGLQTTNNANPNQYVITVTQLDNSSNNDYVIGDPRVSEYTDLTAIKEIDIGDWWSNYVDFNSSSGKAPASAWALAPGIENPSGPGRKLKYYYPTDKSVSKARWIAPAFRIASSFGICPNSNDYEDDQLRCASYQELDCPAGRWRIPTVAEIEFIMKLSQEGKIPVLFSTGTRYMSAQGRINTDDISTGKLNTPANTDGSAAVRCVYDEWFWGDSKLTPTSGTAGQANARYAFTWGDREITR